MKLKRLLFIFLLPILLFSFISCSKDKITIIAEDIGDYYEGIDPFIIYSQSITMEAKIVKENDKSYLRFEGHISKGKLLSGNEFVFYYDKDNERVTLNGTKTNLDEGCLIYANLELEDSEYYITNVGYYLIFPYDGECIYHYIYVPSKNNVSRFSFTKVLDVDFKKNLKWNLNKISLNDKICYMVYVDIVGEKSFDKKFSFEIYNDGIYYPEVKYTNNDKRVYIILEPNMNYLRIDLKYEFVSIQLFDNIDLREDYPYEY